MIVPFGYNPVMLLMVFKYLMRRKWIGISIWENSSSRYLERENWKKITMQVENDELNEYRTTCR